MRSLRLWLPYTVIGFAALVQLLLMLQPITSLLTNILPDDAFYYFQIARNIVEGHGSTFDGITLTNGYHPLWMVILLPLFYFLSDGGIHDLQPIYAALLITVAFNVVTAVLLKGLISRVTNNVWIASLALAAWCLNPFVLYETLNGLETSLALMLLTVFFTLAVRAEKRGTYASYIGVGIAAGLLVLARLDMACYVIAYGVWMLYAHGWVRGLRLGLYAAVPAMALVSLWLAYNVMEFGMLLTSASGGNELVNHTLVAQDNGTGLLVYVRATAYMLVTYCTIVLERMGAAWLLFIAIGLTAARCFISEKRLQWRKPEISLMVAFFAGFLLLFFLNAGIRFTGRTWYFISANLFLALFLAWSLASARFSAMRVSVACAALFLVMIPSFALSWKSTLHNQMSNQQGMYEMAAFIHKSLPVDTVVGVFNAGIIGYFSGIRVINLDGLVNNHAYEAMRTRALFAYIERENISYIADFPIYLTYRYRSFFGIPDVLTRLEQVQAIHTSGSSRGDALILYRVLENR